MTALTPTIATEIGPNLATKMYIYQFTKVTASDYLTCTAEFANAIDGRYVFVNGALESNTEASRVITLTSGTVGAGWAIVIGR